MQNCDLRSLLHTLFKNKLKIDHRNNLRARSKELLGKIIGENICGLGLDKLLRYDITSIIH